VETLRMIAKDDMMGVILAACPSFAPQWQEFRNEWRDEADDFPLYLVLAGFARHLIAMVERGETSDLPAVFAALERLHVEGDHYVREAAAVGFLESLQNLNLHKDAGESERFRPYLGPVSERLWDKLYRFWEHEEPFIDD